MSRRKTCKRWSCASAANAAIAACVSIESSLNIVNCQAQSSCATRSLKLVNCGQGEGDHARRQPQVAQRFSEGLALRQAPLDIALERISFGCVIVVFIEE